MFREMGELLEPLPARSAMERPFVKVHLRDVPD